jgi:hypothetical protein
VPRANGAHPADSQSWERKTKEVLLAATDNLDLTEILATKPYEGIALQKNAKSPCVRNKPRLQEIHVWVKGQRARERAPEPVQHPNLQRCLS